VTTGCSHSKPKKNRLGPFAFNPFEIAVVESDTETAKAVVDLLTTGPLEHLDVAHVTTSSEASNSSITVSDHEGQRCLVYPTADDGYLPPRPLLDADAVIVEGGTYPEISKLVMVGDGYPGDHENVLTYIGHPNATPDLPSDAPYFTLDQQDGIGDAVLNHFRDKANATPLKGLILAGGQSSRMQRDKAALDFHGKSQIDHMRELLAPHCAETFVSIRPDQSKDPVRTTLPQIHDTFLEMGPMGGMLSAMRTDAHAAWLVVACDLPFIDDETLNLLVRERNPYRLATAFTSARDGFPEPLCAIYEPKAIMRLLQFLALGYDCPRKVLINSRTQLLEPLNDVALSNVNRPDEYEAAQRVLQADKAT